MCCDTAQAKGRSSWYLFHNANLCVITETSYTFIFSDYCFNQIRETRLCEPWPLVLLLARGMALQLMCRGRESYFYHSALPLVAATRIVSAAL